MRGQPVVTLLSLGLVLAGCTSAPTSPVSTSGQASLGTPLVANITLPAAVPLVPLDVNGTVGPTGYGCLPDGPCGDFADVDIASVLQKGFANAIDVNVTWPPSEDAASAQAGPTLVVNFRSDEDFYANSAANVPGAWRFHFVLTRLGDQPFTVRVLRSTPSGNAGTAFHLHAAGRALVDDFAAGFPLRIDPPLANLTVTGSAGASPTTVDGGFVRAWAADGSYLGQWPLSARTTVAGAAPAAALQFHGTVPGIRLQAAKPAHGAAPVLRVVARKVVMMPAHPVAPQGETDWTDNVTTVPINAGIYYGDAQGGFVSMEATFNLKSPAGTLVDGSSNCIYCQSGDVVTGSYITSGSVKGDPNLVPGAYKGSYAHPAGGGASGTLVAGTYVTLPDLG